MSKKGIAVFDLDGTITSKDTFLEFIKYTKGNPSFYFGLLLLLPFVLLFYTKLISNHRLKELFFSYFFKGKSVAYLQEKGKEFCEQKLPNFVYHNAMKTIQFHRENNCDILILTASSPLWLKPWCDKHHFGIIGTEFQSKNGILTGKIEGKNCYGIQKEAMLKPVMLQYDFEESYGYGDSKSDEYFFKCLKYSKLGSLKYFEIFRK